MIPSTLCYDVICRLTRLYNAVLLYVYFRIYCTYEVVCSLSVFLSIMSDTMIMDAIASFLVLPNRLTVPLVADLHVAQLRSPLPRVRPHTPQTLYRNKKEEKYFKHMF